MDFAKPTYLYILSTIYSFGIILCWKDDNKERVIYYLSITLIDYETRYRSIEKLCFGIIFAIEKLSDYLLYCTTYVVNLVNPFKYLVEK